MEIRVYRVHYPDNRGGISVSVRDGVAGQEVHDFQNLQDAAVLVKNLLQKNRGAQDVYISTHPNRDIECPKDKMIRVCDPLDSDKRDMLWILVAHGK